MVRPIEFAASQVVGIVESVSPNELTVRLATDAPQATALNAAHVQRFPRINGWLLVPSEAGYVIGTVTWIGAERAPLASDLRTVRRSDSAEFVDLPFTARRLKLAPLGTLRWTTRDGQQRAELLRGIVSYPAVGETALIPSPEQLRAIAETTGTNARISIGVSPLAGDVEVRIDPDRVFGRHLAVLGNTGSGKSCTVAGLVRWSLDAARRELEGVDGEPGPNARFVILDPNGEYGTCFDDVAGVSIFRPVATGGDTPLTVPGWIWSSAEWAAITRASLQAQRPLLQQALRDLRNQIDVDSSSHAWLAQQARGFLSLWQGYAAAPSNYAKFPGHKNVDTALSSLLELFEHADANGHTEVIEDAREEIAAVGDDHLGGKYSDPYKFAEVNRVIDALQELCDRTADNAVITTTSEDAPAVFDVESLPDHLAALTQTADFASGAAHASYLIVRIRTMLSDARLHEIVCPDSGKDLPTWLAELLGDETNADGHVAVVDLSLLASDVVHTIVAVLGRVIMEALQYVRRVSGTALPSVLVLEEAHTFVGRENQSGDIPTTRDLCRETFERISREGRKFGLGLVLSSQRPSELSPTVLSQCNSFLLHRLVNDRDQDLVGRLVPDALGDLLRELPSLPSRQAVLLGWATPVPTLVEIHELAEEQRPHSSDPDFWSTWTRKRSVDFEWGDVQDAWLGPGT